MTLRRRSCATHGARAFQKIILDPAKAFGARRIKLADDAISIAFVKRQSGKFHRTFRADRAAPGRQSENSIQIINRMHHPNESGVLGAESESTAASRQGAGSEPATPRRSGKRDLLFDGMKGFGIILVIMGHALQGNPQFDENFAFRIIYSFHMPLFFFISGYLLQVSLEKHPLAPISFVLKKARTLVVPFLSWYLIFGVWTGMASNVSWHEYVHRLIYSPDFGYWFLWVLFLCFAAILPVAWLQQRIDPRWRPGLIALSWLTLYLLRQTHTGFLGLHLLKVDYFYFAVGFFICCWRKQLSFFQRWWPEICVVGFLLLVPYWRRVGEMPFMPYLRENFPAKAEILRDTFEYSLALMGIGCVAQIVKALLSGPIGRWLAWIGTYTLDIYVIHLHTFLFCPFVVILSSHRGDSFGIATAVAWGIFASLAISFCLIRRSVILKFLFLGIHDSRKSDPVAAGRVALGEVGFSS